MIKENLSTENTNLIKEIVLIEWEMFTNTKNIGSRSACQDEKGNFFASRSAYWSMYNKNVLTSYFDDLKNKKDNNINIVTQKYGYMMKETDYEYFKKIEHLLPKIDDKKASLVESIMLIYMKWEEDLSSSNIDNKNRILYKKHNSKECTSVESYMKGELLSYSENTLLEILSQFLKDLSSKKNPVGNYLEILNKFENRNPCIQNSESNCDCNKNMVDRNNYKSNNNIYADNISNCNKDFQTKNGFNSNLAAHYSNGDLNNKSNINCSFNKKDSICSKESNQSKKDFSKNYSLKRIFSMNLELAEMISNFSIEVAKSIDMDIVVSVVDASSNLILFKKMDNSLNCSIKISQAKAFTSLDFKTDTLSLSKNEELKNLNNFLTGDLNYCFLGGGVPIKSKCGKIIGSLGISGGSVEQDCFVANKAIELFEKSI